LRLWRSCSPWRPPWQQSLAYRLWTGAFKHSSLLYGKVEIDGRLLPRSDVQFLLFFTLGTGDCLSASGGRTQSIRAPTPEPGEGDMTLPPPPPGINRLGLCLGVSFHAILSRPAQAPPCCSPSRDHPGAINDVLVSWCLQSGGRSTPNTKGQSQLTTARVQAWLGFRGQLRFLGPGSWVGLFFMELPGPNKPKSIFLIP